MKMTKGAEIETRRKSKQDLLTKFISGKNIVKYELLHDQ